jgi:starvation-inducible outer membrane lipoprotein
MKFFIALALISTACVAAPTNSKKAEPVRKDLQVTKQKPSAAAKAALKKEEDCDDKAKKQVEIKPESISLTGNAGCSLDEAH